MSSSSSATHALDSVDTVVRFAARVGVGQSMYEIAESISGNVQGTAVLLAAGQIDPNTFPRLAHRRSALLRLRYRAVTQATEWRTRVTVQEGIGRLYHWLAGNQSIPYAVTGGAS